MKIVSAIFNKSATRPAHYPDGEMPEIAFIGRSNVGKSSMINRLVNRKHLVKTSSTPGCTRLINFFDINRSFRFVDLPGYGYARISESEKKSWRNMIETYLSERSCLHGVVLILDIRRDPDEKDRLMIDWLNRYHIPILPVLTKADKISASSRNIQIRRISNAFGFSFSELILFSARTALGLDPLWKAIAVFLDSSRLNPDGRSKESDEFAQ